MTLEANCLCGETSLSIDGEPIGQFFCHCDDCQAVAGAAYLPIALYPKDAVKVTEGNPLQWTYKTNPRTRCANCGTVMYSEPAGAPFVGVKANLLPDGVFKPSSHIMCQYAVRPVVDDLPHFKGFPAAFGGSDEMMDW